MDRGKKQGKFIANKNHKIYMDLKDIIREVALPYLPAKSLRRCTSVCREWRLQISNEICFGDRKLVPSSGVYAGGSVYWGSTTRGILAFNLTSERTTIQSSYSYAARYPPSGVSCALGYTNGKLAVASVIGPQLNVVQLSNTFTNTMQMNSRARAWDTKHEVVIDSSLFEGSRLDQASAMFVGGDTVVIKADKALVCYNMRTRRFSTVAADVDYSSRMVPYVNSLVEM